MPDQATRFNVQLDERYATKLRELAELTHVNPGTLARSLLSAALDEAAPDSSTAVDTSTRMLERENGLFFAFSRTLGFHWAR